MSVIILSISDLIGMSLHIPIRFASTFPQRRLARMRRDAWYPKTYQGWLGLLFIQGTAATYPLLRLFPWAMRFGFYLSRGDTFSWFWNVREQKRARAILIRHFRTQPTFVPSVVRRWKQTWKKFDRASTKIRKKNFSSLSLKEIGRLYEQAVTLNMAQAAYGYVSEPLLTAGEEDWLVKEVRNAIHGRVARKDEETTLATLTQSTIPTFVQEEECARAGLLKLWKRSRKTSLFQQRLREHCERFATIRGNYFSVPLLTEKEVLRSFSSLDAASVREHWTTFRRTAREKRKIIQRYHLESLALLLRASELFTHMQDYRKWAVTKVNEIIFLTVDELARRLSVERETLLYATPMEIIDVCQGKRVDWKQIAVRRKGALTWCAKEGVTIFSGPSIQKMRAEWFYGIQQGMKELRGTTAMSGKVEGRVRLVFGIKEIHAFKDGEILVTNNTTPEFLPAMKKAAAIVTEQGGITTHAAIISRELKIPCVIGTKIATKVLKDGDRVEVDATKGIVRKL